MNVASPALQGSGPFIPFADPATTPPIVGAAILLVACVSTAAAALSFTTKARLRPLAAAGTAAARRNAPINSRHGTLSATPLLTETMLLILAAAVAGAPGRWRAQPRPALSESELRLLIRRSEEDSTLINRTGRTGDSCAAWGRTVPPAGDPPTSGGTAWAAPQAPGTHPSLGEGTIIGTAAALFAGGREESDYPL